MKKSDIILLSVIALIAIVGMIVVNIIQSDSEVEQGVAFVIYDNNPILEIDLTDGSYEILRESDVISIEENIFIVEGANGPVTIEYGDDGVRVIDETSPENICQIQGWSKSPLKPLTCLPNNLVIIIKDNSVPSEIDGING